MPPCLQNNSSLRACQGRRPWPPFISTRDMPVCSRSIRHTIREEHSQLCVDRAPVLPSASPFLFFKKFFLSPLAFRPVGKGREHFLRFPSLFTESSQFEHGKRAISAKNSRKNRPQTEACGFKSSLAGKISLGSTSKNGQQKTPKPLKFRGFLGGYLFRIHNMACGSRKDISRYCFEKYSFS